MDTKPIPIYIPQITYTHFGTYKIHYVSAHEVQPETIYLVCLDFDGASEIFDMEPKNAVHFTPSGPRPKISIQTSNTIV